MEVESLAQTLSDNSSSGNALRMVRFVLLIGKRKQGQRVKGENERTYIIPVS